MHDPFSDHLRETHNASPLQYRRLLLKLKLRTGWVGPIGLDQLGIISYKGPWELPINDRFNLYKYQLILVQRYNTRTKQKQI